MKWWYEKKGMTMPVGKKSPLRFKIQGTMNFFKHDGQLCKENGKYYLVMSDDVECLKSETPTNSVVSIDPGSRCFLTCYDPQGNVTEIGKNDVISFRKLRYKIYTLRKQQETVNHKKRYSIGKMPSTLGTTL